MTDLIKRIISKRTYLLLFNFSIYFTLAHLTSNANWRNNEKQISNCNRIQVQCEDERDMREQIFRCNNGACIPKTYKCDGVEHCCDGSDEWIQECKKTTGKSRKKRAADGHCIVPTPSPDKTIKYECDTADSKSCLVNGLIRENTLATIVCNPNYMPTNGTHLESVCRKKKWIPSIDMCHKICKALTPVNVNLQCSLENRPIACDENSLIAGVKVQPTCKALHTYKGFVPEYNEITCHEDGNWSDMLFKCTAECGIQYAGIKLLISKGTKEQFGDSPWHVAVYDHKKVLICGGTIIHPQLILSAAHCFYDPRSSQKLKPEDFEIVVSKISRNYFTKDNDYQKAFKIREILVSDKGYNHLADYHSADIVILVLKEKLTLSATVLPACIDPIHMKRYPPEGTLAKVVGWGNDENGTLLEFLHTANLPFISRQRCIEVVPDDFKPYVTLDKFCAGSEEGAGVLQGDSGGGLLFQQGSFFFIRGIVSSKRIVDTKIAAFTDLASHVDWIIAVRDRIERENMECKPSPSQNTVPVMTPSTTTPSTISRNYCTISASYSDKTVKYKCPSGGKNQSCVRNGGTEVSEFTKATVICNSGYQLADNETLNWTCTKGSWLPEFPKCENESDRTCKKPTTKPTSTTSKSPAPLPESHCAIPLSYVDKIAVYNCHGGRQPQTCVRIRNGGIAVIEFTKVNFTCKPGYYRVDNKPMTAVCLEGAWHPDLPKCDKICDKLIPMNVDLTCYRSTTHERTDCNGPLLAGDKVQPTCKALHTYEDFVPNYLVLGCQNDGKWDNILFSCVAECGRSFTKPVTLALNSTEEKYGDSPWHVAIYDITKKLLICGGTIINPYLVLSAAHCFYDRLNQRKLPEANYEIVVGKYTRDYNTKDNAVQKAFKLKEIRFSNKGYSAEQTYFANDIAILILQDKIEISPTVLPACVDWIHTESYSPPEGTSGKVVGWGVNELGNFSEKLLSAQLPFISNRRCLQSVPPDFTPYITYDKFCAGSETGLGVEHMDSGGGIVFQSGLSYSIRGIVSLKQPTGTAIVAFTDLAQHIDWVFSVRNEIEQEIIKKGTGLASKG